MSEKKTDLYKKIYEIVRKIPKGKVSTYGQIAKIADCSPRVAGYAMHSVKDKNIPWQRVINSKGMISFPESSQGYDEQRAILEAEGIFFNEKGKIDLKEFGWDTDLEML